MANDVVKAQVPKPSPAPAGGLNLQQRIQRDLQAEFAKGAGMDRNKIAAFTQKLARLKPQFEAAAQNRQLQGQLGQLQGLQEKQFEDLTKGFRVGSEVGVGRALRGTLRGVNQGIASRGFGDSGLSPFIESQARAGLAGQALEAQLNFRDRLSQAQAADQSAFLQNKFAYFDSLQKLEKQFDLNKEMAMFQSKLAQDSQRRNSILNLAGSIGSFIGSGGLSSLSGLFQGNTSQGNAIALGTAGNIPRSF